MWKVFKYPIPIKDEFEVVMPSSSAILKIGNQFDIPRMWVLVQPDSVLITRRFRIFGTGHPIPGGPLYLSESSVSIQQKEGRLKYIDTFKSGGGGLIWHLFELIKND